MGVLVSYVDKENFWTIHIWPFFLANDWTASTVGGLILLGYYKAEKYYFHKQKPVTASGVKIGE